MTATSTITPSPGRAAVVTVRPERKLSPLALAEIRDLLDRTYVCAPPRISPTVVEVELALQNARKLAADIIAIIARDQADRGCGGGAPDATFSTADARPGKMVTRKVIGLVSGQGSHICLPCPIVL